jgi:hypothetical protein
MQFTLRKKPSRDLTIRSSRDRFAARLMRYRVAHRRAAAQSGLTQVLDRFSNSLQPSTGRYTLHEPLTWEIATRVMAIVGVALGILNLILSYLRGSPRFKVSATVDDSKLPPRLIVHIQNHGLYPITVENFWLTSLPQNGSQPRNVEFSVDQKRGLPQTIEMGRSAKFTCAVAAVQQAIDSGNDLIRVGTSDGRSQTSSRCKDLTKRLGVKS